MFNIFLIYRDYKKIKGEKKREKGKRDASKYQKNI
jgi:hypothetical protein